MRVVPYYPVGGPVLRELIEIKLGRLGERLQRRQLAFSHCQASSITWPSAAPRAKRRAPDRPPARQHVLPLVADRLLDAMASGESLSACTPRSTGTPA
jgi:type VI secretion system protein VasG